MRRAPSFSFVPFPELTRFHLRDNAETRPRGYDASPSAPTTGADSGKPWSSRPERPGLLPTASAAELRDEARAVLAALATLPPKQRQVMAWCIDGHTPAEIARELGADPAAVRQNLPRPERTSSNCSP
jgi:DNA-directed RNA polymerase specialized sigma24 family protein